MKNIDDFSKESMLNQGFRQGLVMKTYLMKQQRMIETIIQVQGGRYPFESHGSSQCVRVEEAQHFSTLRQLLQKKAEMQKKRELLQSNYLIKLLKIYQDDLTLLYTYQHVPYSLGKYIKTHYNSDSPQVVEMSAKLFVKKISRELTMMISELARLKIELEVAEDTIGITEDEKIKVFMSPRCRMGHKTEIALLAFYNSKRQKILKFCEEQFYSLRGHQSPANFVIRGNKLLFGGGLNQSIYVGESAAESSFNTYSSNVFSSGNLNRSTASCINPQPNLRQTQSPKFGKNLNFDFHEPKAQSSRSAHKKEFRSHKNSFNFGEQKERHQRRFHKEQQDNSDARSYTHSKSIKIEFQQKTGPFQKKQRKDSVKVKVTTFHEYQMQDCDPAELFGKGKSQQDIFNYFSNHNPTNSQHSQPQQQQPFSPPPRFQRKQSMPQTTQAHSSNTRNLEQKVRLAKQKAESVLSRYLGNKKKASSLYTEGL